MKRLFRFYVLAFLLLDAVLFLATYLLLGQAQSSRGASLSGVKAGNEAVAVLVLPSVLSASPPAATTIDTALLSPTLTETPTATLTDTAIPSAAPTETPTVRLPDTLQPTLTATHTALPSVNPTQIPSVTPTDIPWSSVAQMATPTASATDTVQPGPTASVTPLPSSTNTAQPTFTPITPTPIVDLGILAVPTATVPPTSTPVQDLGILPTVTPSATRPHVTHAVASVPSAVSPNTPVPAAKVYISPAPDCVPHDLPVRGFLSQHFSWYHSGIDIVVPIGTSVLATQSGQVVFAGWRKDGYGNLVIIQNGRFITYYAHNSKLLVNAGQIVNAHDQISLSGTTGWSTGPHVHYEVRINNVPVDPLKFDPQQYSTC